MSNAGWSGELQRNLRFLHVMQGCSLSGDVAATRRAPIPDTEVSHRSTLFRRSSVSCNLETFIVRIFAISFLMGAVLAIAVEVRADDETLPLPMNTTDASSVEPHRYPNTSKEDMIHASRVQRAKYVAAQHLAIETMNRWSGINPGRPMVNSGYMYLAPPRATYRWFGPMQPTYVMPYGMPIE